MPKGRRHFIRDPRLEVAAGLAAFVAGWALLKDAYDDRPGREQPWWLRPFTWW